MKYTIEGFSQKKLIDMRLDVSDALILRWFMDFSATGSMKSVINDGKTYFLVRYEGIIRDIPLLGISSTKGIANRFNKYVELGLMERLIRRGGNNSGCSIYFMATQKLLFLSYEKTDVNEHVQETKRNTQDDKSDSNENTSRTSRDSNHTSCRTSPTGTPVAVATGTPVAVALNNSSTNNSSTTSSSHSEEKIKSETAEEVKKTLKELFGSERLFSADFIPALVDEAEKQNIVERLGEYLRWAHKKSSGSETKNLTGYFYKTAKSSWLMAEFAISCGNLEKQKEQQEVICPACGTRHNMFENCHVCGLGWNERKNKKAVFYAKAKHDLSDETRAALSVEISVYTKKSFVSGDFKSYEQGIDNIYKKYGIHYSEEQAGKNKPA